MVNEEENNPINFDAEVTDWAKRTAVTLIKALDDHKVGVKEKRYGAKYLKKNSGNLRNSIAQEVARNGGSIEKAIFRFLAYGRFVDMGTGRGFYRGKKGTDAFAKHRNGDGFRNGQLFNEVNRKPKPWYTKTMFKQINSLTGTILANMSENVLNTMKARMNRINNHTNSGK